MNHALSLAQERWVQRFAALFWTPTRLFEAREGRCTFQEMKDDAMRNLNVAVAEVENFPDGR